MKQLFLLGGLLLAGCAERTAGPEAAVPAAGQWRAVATPGDRERVRKWRNAWVRALSQARASGHGPALAAEGALLQPDAALKGASPPAGDYRCRTIKLGSRSEGGLTYVAYPPFECRIGPGEGARDFVKRTGSQRPIGRLFPDNDRRLIFLGTLQLGDETGSLRYGHDRHRDMVGLLERVDERRWRLVFPSPAYESQLDVLELLPKD
jgi:hypothetical protein